MENKILLIMGIVSLLLLGGCSDLGKGMWNPVGEFTKSELSPSIEGLSESDRFKVGYLLYFYPPEELGSMNLNDFSYSEVCHWGLYKIEYVDKINKHSCYGIKESDISSWQGDALLKSIQHWEEYSRMPIEEYLIKFHKKVCLKVDLFGKAYCLKDNSLCLIIEGDGKICHEVNLVEK